ncbi:MAG: hypothetical protein HY680_04875 [Chloroflexi bacterium]|nr:hypothetical protein [Chloroflexota bacterium]
MPSGRLDLLCVSGNHLLLVELKVEEFQERFLGQVMSYTRDLVSLQEQGLLVKTPIQSFLLCPSFSEAQSERCRASGVEPVQYSPADVLQEFFSRMQSVARFVSIKPNDNGLWNIYLVHRVLYALLDMSSAQEVAAVTGLSRKSVMNHLRFAEDLFLVRRRGGGWSLTESGARYVVARDARAPVDAISDEQRRTLREFVVKDPFASPTVFGVYSVVECVFTLARNAYPVSVKTLRGYFRDTCGKATQWVTPTSVGHGIGMYSNYAIDLGLLAKIGDRFLLTPDGVRFVLLLQLHKGIAMVDAVSGRNGA